MASIFPPKLSNDAFRFRFLRRRDQGQADQPNQFFELWKFPRAAQPSSESIRAEEGSGGVQTWRHGEARGRRAPVLGGSPVSVPTPEAPPGRRPRDIDAARPPRRTLATFVVFEMCVCVHWGRFGGFAKTVEVRESAGPSRGGASVREVCAFMWVAFGSRASWIKYFQFVFVFSWWDV